MDPTGRMSVSDLTASLEGAMAGEGKTNSGELMATKWTIFFMLWLSITYSTNYLRYRY